MNEIKLKLNEAGRGGFYMYEDGEQVGEMEIGVSNGNLTAYHTGVAEKMRGTGAAAKLFDAMVAHARQHNLRVIPLCSYVRTQFMRKESLYKDIWNKDWRNG